MDDLPNQAQQNRHHHGISTWISAIGLIILLGIGAYFRFIGLDWDDDHHLHPDERFLTMVTNGISSSGWDALQTYDDADSFPEPGSLRRLVFLISHWDNYYSTELSGLNPNNRGYGSYVYGTLPLFIVRLVAEWLDKTGYSENYLIGRAISALFDLGTIILVYFITQKLVKTRWLALLAAAFSAVSVLPIQHSHFYVVDTFANFFTYLSIYIAVQITNGGKPNRKQLTTGKILEQQPDNNVENEESADLNFPESGTGRVYWLDYTTEDWKRGIAYILFGITAGMALACKISAAPVVLLLPAAALIWYYGLDKEQRSRQEIFILRNLAAAAVMALITFRILQPYAFDGPGFFNVGINDHWFSSIKSLSAQSSGTLDSPPELQWARRPITFSWVNMVRYGLGIPLGLLAWISFLWMGWRFFKGENKKYILLWGWTALVFIWQSTSFVKSMRYQLPIYPSLVIIAAWGIAALWDDRLKIHEKISGFREKKLAWNKILAVMIAGSVLVATGAWAFAFTRIYTRPVTRVAASEWVYQNIPAAFNLKLDTGDGNDDYNVPVNFQLGTRVTQSKPLVMAFQAQVDGLVTKVSITHIADRMKQSQDYKVMFGSITSDLEGNDILTTVALNDPFLATSDDSRGQAYDFYFLDTAYLEEDKTYYLNLSTSSDDLPLDINGQITLEITSTDGTHYQALYQPVWALDSGETFYTTFSSPKKGMLKSVYIPEIVDWKATGEEKTLQVKIEVGADQVLATLTDDFNPLSGEKSEGYLLKFDHPVEIIQDMSYSLGLTFIEGTGRIAVYGSQIARESTWDDVVPISMEGYNAWDTTYGLYQSDLNFEMYWNDDGEKVERFQKILDQADTIIITSNRQYGTTTRVDERYPLTTVYYRNLMGCPETESIADCYAVAEPGKYEGSLGYELVQVFESEPNLGSWVFNTQFAEEAFSVYDHPKVFIFRKISSYDPESVRQILNSVDLANVVVTTPAETESYPGNIQLPDDRFETQTEGGTWSEYFNPDFIYNRYPFLALILWYVATSVLGWVVYPFLRIALRGLTDRGFAFCRIAGMLLLAYPVWLAGSAEIPFTRPTIFIVFFLLVGINAYLFWKQKDSILTDFKEQKNQWITIEILTLLFFLLFLFIRLGNPDLWHQYKGGEKPMDFSYFNAVLKSTTFPPYDPWFAGGYINYYYFGFLLAGVPVKALGITPSVAYNLILPSFFSMFAIAAYSIGWNLFAKKKGEEVTDDELFFRDSILPVDRTVGENTIDIQMDILTETSQENSVPEEPEKKRNEWISIFQSKPFLAGIASSFLVLILGNLGTLRMIWHGLIKLVVSGEQMDAAGSIQLWLWSFQGLGKFLSGATLPYSAGDWYWIPSRAIPGEPITEFPFFTFLYADPHAHLFALPVTLLVIGCCLAWLRQRCRWDKAELGSSWLQVIAVAVLSCMAIGALRPINTWDMPTYLALGIVVMAYTMVRWLTLPNDFLPWFKPKLKVGIVTAISVFGMIALSFVMYQPYTQWYAPGYQSVEIWNGSHTPFWSYITHWGLFLFFIISWMIWETRDWMALTPLSSLKKLRPYRPFLLILLGGVLITIVFFLYRGVNIAWFSIPLGIWAVLLILRPDQDDLKRLVLFCIGTALMLTLAVEVIVLKGDIGRMNTVFKFYLQAWSLFSLSAAAAVFWLIDAVRYKWGTFWRRSWKIACVFLVLSAALFPILAGASKIKDRIAENAPHTLDGMRYMDFAFYFDQEVNMDLSQDYEAIRWMQENVTGSPVIVEGNTPEYRWGSRFTVYTGLPGVVGWNWHQRQQRTLTPSNWVTDRIAEVEQFYLTTDRLLAESFLRKYDVKYIVVGQLERAYYPGLGLEKFDNLEGDLWVEVFRYEDTVIYQVVIE